MWLLVSSLKRKSFPLCLNRVPYYDYERYIRYVADKAELSEDEARWYVDICYYGVLRRFREFIDIVFTTYKLYDPYVRVYRDFSYRELFDFMMSGEDVWFCHTSGGEFLELFVFDPFLEHTIEKRDGRMYLDSLSKTISKRRLKQLERLGVKFVEIQPGSNI